jgi:hypothetical protein
MNANLYGSICIALVAMCGHYSRGTLRAVGPLTPPPLTPPAKAPVEKGGAKRLDGADVGCEESSQIFCKIHYRAFASPTAPKNRLGRCTLTPIQSAAFKH